MFERFKRKPKEDEMVIEGLQPKKNFKDLNNLAIRRSNEAKEFSPRAQGQITVRVPDDIVVNFISDIHGWHPQTHHERVDEELEAIRQNKKSKIIWGGDLVEGVHWGGASMEQVGSLDEQHKWLREMFKKMKGKTIGAVSGEHDSKWAAKTGMDPYADFQDLTGAPYVRGIMEVKIVAHGQTYDGFVSHKWRGNSIYNSTHPVMRGNRELQNGDFFFGGHTHRKGLALQPQREVGGARMVAYGIGGPYKETDDYTQRSGWLSQKTKQLFGFAVRFNPRDKEIEISEDIVKANKRWR